MALFRSERDIGRGETPESLVEGPLIGLFALVAIGSTLAVHALFGNAAATVAVAVSIAVFVITLFRVHFGIYLLVIAMLLSPEVAGREMGAGERNLVLRYDDLLIFVVFLGVMLRQAFENHPRFILPTPINWAIGAYMLVVTISTARGFYYNVPAYDTFTAQFVYMKMWQYYLIFFLVGTSINDMGMVRRQLILFFAVSLVVAFYGIYSIGALARVSAPFESGGTEPNTLGGYLVVIVSVAAGLFIHVRDPRTRFLLAALIVISIIPFLFTLSRASYLAFIAAALTLGLVSKKYLLIGCTAGVLFLSPILMPVEVRERVNYTFQEGSGERVSVFGFDTGLQVDKSTYERIYVWEKVRFNLTVWPWLGGGVYWGRVLDSQYARVLIETGILGFLTFAALQFQILRCTHQTYRWHDDPVAKGLAIGIFTATVGLMVHSLGTVTFLIIRIMGPFWFLVALTMVARDIAIRTHYHRWLEQRAAEEAASTAPAPIPAAEDAAPAALPKAG